MTNFEILTQKPFALGEFLEMAADDALGAEGRSLDQKMPGGIPFEAMRSHTTVGAPETVRFVREDFRRLEEKGVK